jgi:hypothetical protein
MKQKANAPKEEKKEEASEPQQNQLITHEAQLETNLDEKISKKLEQVEKEENDQAEKAKAEAANEKNIFSSETNKDTQATDQSEPLKLAGMNIDDL